jgi:hypothetical protein
MLWLFPGLRTLCIASAEVGEELDVDLSVMLWLFPGLRTLCIASAEVAEEFYDEWKHTYYKASTSLQNRDKKLEEAAELIERVQNRDRFYDLYKKYNVGVFDGVL